MRDQGQHDSSIDLVIYRESQFELRKFKSKLPVEAVEDLAREVIRRLAERDQGISINGPSSD